MGGAVNLDMARALRNNPTDAERALWRRLWQRQFNEFKFRRQQPIGSYIVDFVCLEKKLIIEVDGGQHAASAQDLERTSWLEGRGFRVLRFWNNQVLKEIEAVTKAFWEALPCENGTPHPVSSTGQALNPPPQGGRKYSTHTSAS